MFELRLNMNEAEMLKKQNAFIAVNKDEDDVPQADDSEYEEKIEELSLAQLFEPYQLKTCYKIKNVDEINWEMEEDEDALVLAEQPFETAMQVGFGDYLNHLNTKFRARRSDIIVSSTLSITLTPIESLVSPTHFCTITSEEKDLYVQQRNKYRALSILSNDLPKRKGRRGSRTPAYWLLSSYGSNFYSSNFSEEPQSQLFEESDSNDENESGYTIKSHHYIMPATLLNEPLHPNQVERLKPKDYKLYNLQKGKYEVI